jgi:hypothetical protein
MMKSSRSYWPILAPLTALLVFVFQFFAPASGITTVRAATIGVDGDLSDWAGLTTFSDPGTDAGGGSGDLVALWITFDGSNLYVRWDLYLSSNVNQVKSDAFAVLLSNDGSGTMNAKVWVMFNSSGVPTTQIEYPLGTFTTLGSAAQSCAFSPCANGDFVGVEASMPYSSFNAGDVIGLAGITLASPSTSSNIKDCIPGGSSCSGFISINRTTGDIVQVTPTSTPTATTALIATATATASQTPTATDTATPTETATNTPTQTVSATNTATPTNTQTATHTATATVTASATPTRTPTKTSTTSNAGGNATATYTATASLTATPTAPLASTATSDSAAAFNVGGATNSPTPTATASATTQSASPMPSATSTLVLPPTEPRVFSWFERVRTYSDDLRNRLNQTSPGSVFKRLTQGVSLELMPEGKLNLNDRQGLTVIQVTQGALLGFGVFFTVMSLALIFGARWFLLAHSDIELEISTHTPRIPVNRLKRVRGVWRGSRIASDLGWLSGSAEPGKRGDCVILGRHTLANGSPGHFAKLEVLREADEIIIYYRGKRLLYRVVAIQSGRGTPSFKIETDTRSQLTLVTNLPGRSATGRQHLLVKALLVG